MRVKGRAHAQKEHHDIGVKLKLEISLAEAPGQTATDTVVAPGASICAWTRVRNLTCGRLREHGGGDGGGQVLGRVANRGPRVLRARGCRCRFAPPAKVRALASQRRRGAGKFK